MSESDKVDHWKLLADKVGAKVSDAPIQAQGDAASAAAPVTKISPAPVERPKPARPQPRPARKNHWGSLAGELGLEATIEDEEAAREEKTVDAPPAMTSAAISQAVDEDDWPAETDDAETDDVDAYDADAYDTYDADTEDAKRMRELDDDDEFSFDKSEVAVETESADVDDAETFSFLSEVEFPSNDRESSAASAWDGANEDLVAEVATEDADAADDEAAGNESAETKSEGEGEQRPRRRRRRRRRGGRGNREEGAEGEKGESPIAKANDDDADGNDDGVGVGVGGEEQVDESIGGGVDDSLDEADDAGDVIDPSDDDDDSAHDEHVTHHNIPTWQEAIGVVIDSNLESRSKAPSQRPRGRGGRGRGSRKPS